MGLELIQIMMVSTTELTLKPHQVVVSRMISLTFLMALTAMFSGTTSTTTRKDDCTELGEDITEGSTGSTTTKTE